MNFYNWIFFIIRVLTIVPLGYLVIKQGVNMIRRHGVNGLNSVRRALLLLTTVILCRQIVYFIGDIHSLFFNRDKHIWLDNAQPILLVVNIAILYGILRFYQLFRDSE